MAYIASTANQISDAVSTTYTVELPAHQTDDVIYVCVSQDGAATTISTATSGWTAIGTQAAFAGARQVWFFKVATSGAETNPVFSGTNDDWISTTIAVRDADITGTPHLISTRKDWQNVAVETFPTLDASANGAGQLLLYSLVQDVIATASTMVIATPGGLVQIANEWNSILHLVGYRVLDAAGTTPTISFLPNLNTDGGNAWCLAIKNKTGGIVQRICTEHLEVLQWHGGLGRWVENLPSTATLRAVTGNSTTDILTVTGNDYVNGDQFVTNVTAGGAGTAQTTVYYVVNHSGGATFQFSLDPGGTPVNFTSDITSGFTAKITGKYNAPSDIAASINGITCSATKPRISIAGAVPGLGVVTGDTIGSVENLGTPGWVGCTYVLESTANLSGNTFSVQWVTETTWKSRVGAEGAIVVFADGAGAWVAYQLGSKATASNSALYTSVIAVGAATAYASSGSINWSNVRKIGYFLHRPAALTTLSGITVRCSAVLSRMVLRHGGASWPHTPTGLAEYFGWYTSHLISAQGTGQVLIKGDLQIGDGTAATYWKGSVGSIETPLAYSATNVDRRAWNVNASTQKITVKSSASDVVRLDNSIAASDDVQRLVIDAASSTSADYQLAGLNVVSKAVEWKTGVPATLVNFVRCAPITGNGATFSNCVIRGCVSGTAALVLTAGGDAIDCEFTKGSETYAVDLTQAGTYDLSRTTYSGYTTPVRVSATTGTVTIVLDADDTEPAYSSAGATVVFDQAVAGTTLDAPNIPNGSAVGVYNVTADTQLDYQASVSGGAGYSLSLTPGVDYTVGDEIELRAIKIAGTTASTAYSFRTTTSPAGGTIILSTSLPADEVYNDNAIDGSGVAEFSPDYPNLQIDVSDGDGITSVKRLYAWWVDNLATEDGMRTFWGGLVAEDVANYRVVTATLNLKLDNTNPAPVLVVDGRLYRDDGATVIASTSGSIQMDPGKVYVAETGTSGLTPTEAATLAKLDTLTEDVSGLRFKSKALETAPVGSGLTAQQVRDALKLAPSVGAAAAGSIDAQLDALPTAAENRAEMDANSTRLANLDATVSSRLAVASYTAPDNAGIASIDGRLPADPASQSGVDTALALLPVPLDTADTQAAVVAGLTTYDPPTKAEMDAAIAAIPAAPSAAVVADQVLARNLAGGSDGGRTVRDALRANRNRVQIDGSTLTVYAEDDATPAWTGAINTAARDALQGIDPA